MNRALLVALPSALFALFPWSAGAADPAAGENQSDPFAGPSEPPPAAEPDEDALLRGPAKPSPPAPPARAVPRSSRRVAQVSEESASPPAPAAPHDLSGVALELSTSGFASGGLVGGIFVGGRTASGLIIGGQFDYGLQSTAFSVNGSSMTTSTQLFRLGGGVRQSFAHSADRRVDLYGAGDVTFEYHSADVPSTATAAPTAVVSAAGVSLAMGPGLRLWLHEQIAIGYVARFRLTYLSGDGGVLAASVGADQNNASTTSIGFDGTFQILGVF